MRKHWVFFWFFPCSVGSKCSGSVLVLWWNTEFDNCGRTLNCSQSCGLTGCLRKKQISTPLRFRRGRSEKERRAKQLQSRQLISVKSVFLFSFIWFFQSCPRVRTLLGMCAALKICFSIIYFFFFCFLTASVAASHQNPFAAELLCLCSWWFRNNFFFPAWCLIGWCLLNLFWSFTDQTIKAVPVDQTVRKTPSHNHHHHHDKRQKVNNCHRNGAEGAGIKAT